MATRRTFLRNTAAVGAGVLLVQAQNAHAAFYEKEPAFQLSSHILHTVYWTSISGKGGEPKGDLAKLIDRNFGSYAKNRRNDYVNQFFSLIDWDNAASRLRAATPAQGLA